MNLALLLGLCVLVAAWLAPLHALLPGPFTAHMTMHMAVVAVAAPLIALGLAGRRNDPVRAWPAVFAPLPLSMLELVVVWMWHAPGLHHFARHSALGVAFEQASFFACGTALWLSVLGGARRERARRTAQGVVALLLTSMHVTLLGALLALPQRVLYAHAHHAAHGQLSVLEDQQLGGAIMLTVGGVVYLAGGLWLMARLIRSRRAPALDTAAPPLGTGP